MVFKTSQMLLLTSPAKARGKEEVRRTTLPYIQKSTSARMRRSAAIGRRTTGPLDRTAMTVCRVGPAASRIGWPVGSSRPPRRKVPRTARRGRREQPRGAVRRRPSRPHNFNKIGVLFNTKYFILDNNGF
jgi:hypothetical protein